MRVRKREEERERVRVWRYKRCEKRKIEKNKSRERECVSVREIIRFKLSSISLLAVVGRLLQQFLCKVSISFDEISKTIEKYICIFAH